MNDQSEMLAAKMFAADAIARAEVLVKGIDWEGESEPYDMLVQLRDALNKGTKPEEWDPLRASRLGFSLEEEGKGRTLEFAASQALHNAYIEVDEYLYQMYLLSVT